MGEKAEMEEERVVGKKRQIEECMGVEEETGDRGGRGLSVSRERQEEKTLGYDEVKKATKKKESVEA